MGLIVAHEMAWRGGSLASPGCGQGSRRFEAALTPSEETHVEQCVRCRAERRLRRAGIAAPAHPIVLPAPYEDLGLIGVGGTAEVRRVWDRSAGRTLAMKVLASKLVDDPRARARLFGEARLTAALHHRGVVPVLDRGELFDGRPWFTMEEVAGATLAQLLARGATGLLRLLAQAAEVVAHAHVRGVIHRDLKPQNVMVGRRGAVVIDWGFARVLTDVTGEGVGTVVGTPGYMAPEQALGQVDRLDARTDVYALGAILYEILRGRRPRVGTGAEVLARVARGVPRRQGGPMELAHLCVDAMARDMALRPADAGVFAIRLRAAGMFDPACDAGAPRDIRLAASR